MISAIGYEKDGAVKIGRAALNCSECYSYFKTSPAEWDSPMSGDPKCRTRKQLMEDYLHQLMKQILELNPELQELLRQTENDELLYKNKDFSLMKHFLEFMHQPKDSVLLLVGCPASEEWMHENHRKAYEALISRATGIHMKNVRVVPESRAAIFSAFDLNKDVVIDTTKGVMVFDFGSLTADCTYLLLGRKQEEHSWTLGAGRIEQNLTDMATRHLDMSQFFSEDIRRMPLWARSDKEAYFNAQTDKIHSQRLRKCRRHPQTGIEELIPLGPDKFTGKMLYESQTIHIPINSETMGCSVFGKKATEDCNGMTFCVRKDGRPDPVQASWYEHCRSFFYEMKHMLLNQNLPCGTVVLTGGASKMCFVQQLWRETFSEVPQENMILEKVPAFSVSVGLCYLGNAWIRSNEVYGAVLHGMRQDVKESIKRRADKVCGQAAKHAYGLVYHQLEGAGFFQISTVEAITSSIQRAFENDPTFGRLIQDGLGESLTLDTVQMQQEAVQKIVSQLYPGLDGMIRPMENKGYMKSLREQCGNERLGGRIGIAVSRKVLEAIGEVSSGIVAVVLMGVMVIILGPIGWIGGLVAGSMLYDKVKEMVTRYSFTPCSVRAIASSLRRKRESYIQEYKESICTCINSILQSDDCMGQNYKRYLDHAEKESRDLAEVLSLQKFT